MRRLSNVTLKWKLGAESPTSQAIHTKLKSLQAIIAATDVCKDQFASINENYKQKISIMKHHEF